MLKTLVAERNIGKEKQVGLYIRVKTLSEYVKITRHSVDKIFREMFNSCGIEPLVKIPDPKHKESYLLDIHYCSLYDALDSGDDIYFVQIDRKDLKKIHENIKT